MENNFILFIQSLLTNSKKSISITESTTLSEFIKQCEEILGEAINFITVGSKIYSKVSHGMMTLAELGFQTMSKVVALIRNLGGTSEEE